MLNTVIASSRRRVVYDPDAVARATQITAAGGSVTPEKLLILSDLFKAEKLAGRWDKLTSLWMPIWGVPAANLIDLKTGGTASAFAGTWSHAAGYAQGNGSNNYFNTNRTLGGLGFSSSSLSAGWLARGGLGARAAFGCGTTSSTRIFRAVGNIVMAGGAATLTSNHTVGGVYVVAFNGTTVSVRRRNNGSGFATVAIADIPYVGPFGGGPFFFAAHNNTNGWQFSPSFQSGAQYGAWFTGTYTTESEQNGFTANLKTAWESLTGLTLP